MTDKPRFRVKARTARTAHLTDIMPLLRRTKMREQVIESLEATLERARNGQVVAVAIVEQTPDGGTYNHWSLGDNLNIVLGGVARLMMALYNDNKSD